MIDRFIVKAKVIICYLLNVSYASRTSKDFGAYE